MNGKYSQPHAVARDEYGRYQSPEPNAPDLPEICFGVSRGSSYQPPASQLPINPLGSRVEPPSTPWNPVNHSMPRLGPGNPVPRGLPDVTDYNNSPGVGTYMLYSDGGLRLAQKRGIPEPVVTLDEGPV